MATISWVGNGQNISQQDTITVLAVATGAVLSATINGKTLSYTCLASDTTATAATAWASILANSSLQPPEFSSITWTNPSPGVILATANAPGTPFTLTTSASGGAGVNQSHTQPNVSQSDVTNPANYSLNRLPGPADDFVLQNSTVSLLWNLDKFPQVNSITRWQTFTGTIGLPIFNPAGYNEYRPTYLTVGGASSSSSSSGGPALLKVTLGVGQTGRGPQRERYNFLGQATAVTVLKTGSALDTYSVVLLGTSGQNTLTVVSGSVGIAMVAGEVSTFSSINADGGATVALGPLVTLPGTLTLQGATGQVYNVPQAIVCNQGASLIVGSTGQLYPSITAIGSSTVTWLSDSNLTTLVLQTSSTLDKSQDVRPMTIAASTIDGDTCRVLDPNNCITWTTATVIKNSVASGPFTFGANRTVKIT